MIVIESGTNRGCLAITIISSAVIEGQEEINLAINTTTVAAVVDGTTTVVISSDGSMSNSTHSAELPFGGIVVRAPDYLYMK